MSNLTFQYPNWYLLLCVLLGLGYAILLYFRDNRFKDTGSWTNLVLGALRFVAVSALSLLLLSPLLKSLISTTQKPIVVIGKDVSESIKEGMSADELTSYNASFNQLTNDLKEKYDVKIYAFGSAVRENPTDSLFDKSTNISEFLTYLYDTYSHQNLGAVIMATDGIYNEGSNPIYAGAKLSAPIYTVALGDTTPRRDLIVKRVFYNKIVYLGDKFSIQVDVAANNCLGEQTSLTISKINDGSQQTIKSVPIAINRQNFFTTKEVILNANQAGVQHFRITVNKVKNEVTVANNTKDIYIDVLDARQKILLLAGAPHPDIAALRDVLKSNKNYQVDVKYVGNSDINVAQYDFAILHGIPSKSQSTDAILNILNQKNIPRLFIVSSKTDIQKLDLVQDVVSISGDGSNINDVQAIVANNFSLFTLDDNLKKELSRFPPANAPFGEYKEGGNAFTFLYQRIGKVDTKYPLLIFGERQNIKTGVLCASGIWKWRLFDYLQHQNHDIFDGFIGKTIQYLSVKEDKRKFRVNLTQNIFKENEKIYFDAQLYNDSYELINDPDAQLVITNGEGKEFKFTFSRKGKSYGLNAGIFPVGNYTYLGMVNYEGKLLKNSGKFSVKPVQLEVFESTANHSMLKLLSEKFGGTMVFPDKISTISNLLESKGTVKPIIYQTTKTRSVINLRWIFFLLSGLLILEWFLRRFWGGY